MKKITTLVILLALLITTAACSSTTTDLSGNSEITELVAASIENDETGTASELINTVAAVSNPDVEYDAEDLETSPLDADGTTQVQLNGTEIFVDGAGAAVEGSILTINAAGTYQISGTLDDGQIIVDTVDAENVTLILSGVDITSRSSAPIYVANAEKVILNLAEGSENTVTDVDTYLALDEDGEPNAAIFSKDDLTINGKGALTVNASYNNGITSKDDLKITGGTITVNASNDGVKGKDSVSIKDGVITINAGADGVQSTNADEEGKGYVAIEGGVLTIIAGLDGVQAETSLLVSGGSLDITTGGGSVSSAGGSGFGGRGMEGNSNQTDESVKGLKAGINLVISGGEITVSALDDALHANATVTINGGEIVAASGDDGVHAETALTINDGVLNITESYEGLEAQVITINDGIIHLLSSDDGINASSGTGDMGGFGASSNYVYINGGYLYMDAAGDGLDSNGNFEMTGGVVIVNGPTSNGNGPLDYMSSFKISGGFLVAVGSAGMAQAPSTDSTQYSVMQILGTMQPAGTMVHIESTSGENILTFLPTKEYQSVLVSSPELSNNESYVVYTGGSADGTSVNGLYTDGSYSPGTQVASFTITSIVTGGGQAMQGGPGGVRPGGGRGGRP